jgi:hypothetical protein
MRPTLARGTYRQLSNSLDRRIRRPHHFFGLSVSRSPDEAPIQKIVCTGEKEENCPGEHDIFYLCGYFGSASRLRMAFVRVLSHGTSEQKQSVAISVATH